MTTGKRGLVREGAATEDQAGSRRYRDPLFGAMAVKVLPGEHYISAMPDEMLVTVLGSCVAACIRDPVAGVGGMNHFMLPESSGSEWGGASSGMRYGNVAMERLINDILKQGGQRERLEIKVFGGGNVLLSSVLIGDRNADFVEAYLAAEGLPIAARDLRGSQARRVHYFPVSGKVMMRTLERGEDEEVGGNEARYRSTLKAAPVEGSIELFE
jgi:chemotaxis protein CheD